MRGTNRRIGSRAWARAALIALVALMAVASRAAAVAPSLRTDADLDELVVAALDAAVAGSPKLAYRSLAEHSLVPVSQRGAFVVEGERTHAEARRRFGISVGWERLDLVRRGTRLVRIRCLERFDGGGLVWRFVFYRADKVWKLASVKLDDDLAAAFDGGEFAPEPPAEAAPGGAAGDG